MKIIQRFLLPGLLLLSACTAPSIIPAPAEPTGINITDTPTPFLASTEISVSPAATSTVFELLSSPTLEATSMVMTATSTPSFQVPPAVPDLVIISMYVEMQGRAENCVSSYAPYEIRVVVRNVGDIVSNGFFVNVNEMQQAFQGQLPPGQTYTFYFPNIPADGVAEGRVDSTNLVSEADETNNTLQYIVLTPTPPAVCTPTPTPASGT